MEAVVLDRVGFLAYFCPKQGQDFKPSAAPLYPNVGQVPPPGAQVLGFKTLSNFCVLFTQARLAIKSKMK